MKKLIAVFAVLLFVAPAFAADWSFYGSERIATWYNSRDYGESPQNDVNGQSSDASTQLYLQGNSRFGAKVKADKVTGQIELGLTAAGNGDGGDGTANVRRAYGVWKFSDTASLKVGKDYSPVTDFISNQWYDGDNDMLGTGNFYGRRPALLGLTIGNFEIAALTPSYGYLTNNNAGDAGNGTGITGATAGANPNSYIPRFEAAYQLTLGSGYIRPFGGFQYYSVNQGTSNLTDSIDMWSYVVGISTSWNIGAFSIGGQVSYGMNEGDVTSWAFGYANRSASQAVLKANGKDVEDVYTYQAMIVPALKFTDTLRFEAGFGWRLDQVSDVTNVRDTGQWITYLQAMITMAPGVFLCPEVGYIDYMDNSAGNDAGYQWYAGAKWQIDF
jgi:hypothetical protein